MVLCSTALAAPAHAQRYYREIVLVNQSHAPVAAFYASNVGHDAWADNLLEGARLRPNHYVSLDLDGGYCRFNFKTVFADGSSVIRHNVDACVVTTYTVTD
jgi:hypothetical protein